MIDGGCPVQLSEYIPRHRDTSEWKGVPKGIIDELPGDVVHDDPWPDTPSLALEVLMEKCEYTPHSATTFPTQSYVPTPAPP